ncbi:T9SS type A sorting domain-containing protein [Tamlana agarivorans]|uniref:T9SS type A sorting domain-containing protein n=1 Tax=Pseudotamlana agarivorans TaxID=481183 RepID=A0ACC5U9G3_9FLAO|nr:T9SS type A sorting domain-containing protein [Tamlana agarivorans]
MKKSNTIDISQLPQGVYILKVTDQNYVTTKKFIKQ